MNVLDETERAKGKYLGALLLSQVVSCVKFSVESGEFKGEHAAGILTCRLAQPNCP